MINKEDPHAARPNSRRPPPRRNEPSCVPNHDPLWVILPVGQRERILSALSRLVAQQLAKQPDGKEVTHERS